MMAVATIGNGIQRGFVRIIGSELMQVVLDSGAVTAEVFTDAAAPNEGDLAAAGLPASGVDHSATTGITALTEPGFEFGESEPPRAAG